MDNSKSFLTLRGFESHYVDRRPHTIDLSSHKGCDRGCAMCHLTLFGLTDMTEATPADFLHQMELALDGIEPDGPLKINMMGMGDITLHSLHGAIEPIISSKARSMGWSEVQIRISTPGFGRIQNSPILSNLNVKYYWSLLTLNKEKRKKYLPNAIPPKDFLKYLMNRYGEDFVVHFPIIKGVNSSAKELVDIRDFLPDNTQINLLPFKDKKANVLDIREFAYKILSKKHRVKLIPITGLEVGASCGIFRQTIPERTRNA